jgi:hypothetical protein
VLRGPSTAVGEARCAQDGRSAGPCGLATLLQVLTINPLLTTNPPTEQALTRCGLPLLSTCNVEDNHGIAISIFPAS